MDAQFIEKVAELTKENPNFKGLVFVDPSHGAFSCTSRLRAHGIAVQGNHSET